MYAIKSKDNRYLNTKWDLTKNPYYWEKRTSVENVIRSCKSHPPKKLDVELVKSLKIVEKGKKESLKPKEVPKMQTPKKPMNLSEAIHSTFEILDRLETIMEAHTLSKMHSEADQKQQDVLHKIECTRFSASEGYMYSKMLQEIRKERREIKILQNILPEYKKLREGKYTPRQLEDLF